MKRILLATIAALGLALGSGTALAQHGGGGGHSGGGGWHGGGGGGGWHGGGGGWHGGGGHGHGGSHFVVGIGFPGFYWGGWGYPYYGYYGYPYYASYPYGAGYPYYGGYPSYYPDEPAYGDPAPGNYIQRDMSGGAPVGEGQYSYYCPDPAGYYPQLQNCPKGWLKVVPDAGPHPGTR